MSIVHVKTDERSVPLFVPLNTTTINWNDYIKASKDITGIHATQIVEREPSIVSQDATFLKTILNLKTGNVNLYKSAGLEKHLFYMFLVGRIDFCTHAVRFVECNIDTTDLGPLYLFSSTLSNWISFVTRYSTLDVSFELRFIANCVHFHLLHLGLEPLFSSWKRQICNDGTTILTRG